MGIEMEKKYWELRENMERKWDKWVGTPSNDKLFQEYKVAELQFNSYCVDVLTELMEEHSDILKNLKGV